MINLEERPPVGKGQKAAIFPTSHTGLIMNEQEMNELLYRRLESHYRSEPVMKVVSRFEFDPGVVGVEVEIGRLGVFYELWYDRRWNVPVRRLQRYGSPDHETGVGVIQYHLTMSSVHSMADLMVFMLNVLDLEKT